MSNGDGNKEGDGDGNKGGGQATAVAMKWVMATVTRVVGNETSNS